MLERQAASGDKATGHETFSPVQPGGLGFQNPGLGIRRNLER